MNTEISNNKKTVLYYVHKSLNAKMVPFGGFEMPIQYEGIIKEHQNTREGVSLFDTCHMGEIRISGEHACSDLERILTCSVSTLKSGQCRYGLICNEKGGVIDDQIVYRIREDGFIMVVNASTLEHDFEWIKLHVSPDTLVTNISDITAKIDVQGPKAPSVIADIFDNSIQELKFFTFKYCYFKDTKVLVSRTGYTGEIGFELYGPVDLAIDVWNECMKRGAKPAGLGCRDILRLEVGLPLYGHELSETRNALESGFSHCISRDKRFIGSDRIFDPNNFSQKLVGLILEGRRSARHEDAIYSEQEEKIGAITSGSFSPSLQTAIAMGYIKKEYAEPGTRVKINTQRQNISAQVTELPFYKKATAREPIAKFL